jgi:hypothetical protein
MEVTAKFLVFLYCNGLLTGMLLHISVISSNTFQILSAEYYVQLFYFCAAGSLLLIVGVQ